MKLAILGSGSFGTSLAIHLSKNFKTIEIHTISKEVLEDININKRNNRYLKNIIIPDNIKCSMNLESVISGADFIVFAVPSQAVREVAKNSCKFIKENQIVVNLAKGIENTSFKRLSEVIKEELPQINPVILSGPSHAEEIAQNMFTTLIAASSDENSSLKVQEHFSTDSLRIYTNNDVIGVEIGGACKNIIALASGILHGMGCGDNTKAALMVRGIKEIADISEKLGGNPQTLHGLSGTGDLIVTCTSPHSRNRQAGILLAKGYSLEEVQIEVGMVIEGVAACKCFFELAKELNVDLPITSALYSILFLGKTAKECFYSLTKREKKAEF